MLTQTRYEQFQNDRKKLLYLMELVLLVFRWHASSWCDYLQFQTEISLKLFTMTTKSLDRGQIVWQREMDRFVIRTVFVNSVN